MNFLDELTRIARDQPRVVVLAEAGDERMIRAAEILAAQNIASPVLTGSNEKIKSVAANCGASLNGVRVADPSSDSATLERFVAACADGPRPLKAGIARRLMLKPLMFGAMMTRLGEAQAMIAGASVPTARVVEAGLIILGPESGVATPSSYFLMLIPENEDNAERALVFADCAVNIDPTSEQLSDISISTARNAKQLLNTEPLIAMLSFSTKGSARHEFIEKVSRALEITREKLPELKIDGEFQFDTAIDARTASLKLSEPGEIAGQANVLIFPNLDSGNIGYKITQYLARAQAIGPILQGFARPISDLSRGATIDDIVKTTIVLLASTAD